MEKFYFRNWIVAAETIKRRKLFQGGNYSRKYGIRTAFIFFVYDKKITKTTGIWAQDPTGGKFEFRIIFELKLWGEYNKKNTKF